MESQNNSVIEFRDKIREILGSYGLASGSTSLVAGVSGGVDSMVMLHNLAVSLKFDVTAAHINYGKRGEASDADEALVRSYCRQNDIPLEVHNIENQPEDRWEQGNFQDYARNLRRRFLLSVMQKQKAQAICLAHHRDDQIETIFQKILRGAAAENWRGMTPADSPWIRPLLPFSRSDILSIARELNIPYRTDTSNLENDYDRNLIRNNIFPVLESRFPGWRQNLVRVSQFGSLHGELLDYVTGQVTDISEKNAADHADGQQVTSGLLNRNRWLSLPESLRIPVARHWIKNQTGFTEWSRGAVTRLEELERIQTGSRVGISDRYAVMRDRDHFVMAEVLPDNAKADSKRFSQASDDRTDTSGHQIFPVIFRLSEISGDAMNLAGWYFSVSRYHHELKTGALQLKWERLPEVLLLRKWQDSDRIRPLGMEGYQLVSDHLTNRKIRASRKKESLVMVSKDEMVHALLFPHPLENGEIGTIAEHARCHSTEDRVLLIQAKDPST